VLCYRQTAVPEIATVLGSESVEVVGMIGLGVDTVDVDLSAGSLILNLVVQFPAMVLDRTFAALADAHRRQILDRLGDGPVSISELAVPLGMSLPGVLKHVRALERARLIATEKRGRTRWCRLAERPLDGASAWIDERRALWERRLDRFEGSLDGVGPAR
jgi:DNA-binding transcriptional ArsR family regulator